MNKRHSLQHSYHRDGVTTQSTILKQDSYSGDRCLTNPAYLPEQHLSTSSWCEASTPQSPPPPPPERSVVFAVALLYAPHLKDGLPLHKAGNTRWLTVPCCCRAAPVSRVSSSKTRPPQRSVHCSSVCVLAFIGVTRNRLRKGCKFSMGL